MKILIVNSFLYPRGGDTNYVIKLRELLNKNNHIVKLWGMKHENNVSKDLEEFFLPYIDFYKLFENKKFNSIAKVLSRVIWSKEARILFELFLREYKPDLIHLSNIHHHISPSILEITEKLQIPVVWTLHDFKLVCPNTNFYNDRKQQICQLCEGNKFYFPLITRCKKGSFGASLIASIESFFHLYKSIKDRVNHFIVPSEFLAKKLIQNGFSEKKISIIQNFIEDKCMKFSTNNRNYILFIGRLTKIKGIYNILRIAEYLKNVIFVIIGDGDDEIKKSINESVVNIKYLGYQTGERLEETLSNSKFLIAPSICIENFPYTIIEAFAKGKPVLGSKLGGILELIGENEERGYFFDPYDYRSMIKTIEFAMSDDLMYEKKSENAFNYVSSLCSEQAYYKKLISIYERLI